MNTITCRYLCVALWVVLFTGCAKKSVGETKATGPSIAKTVETAPVSDAKNEPPIAEKEKSRLGEKVLPGTIKRLDRCIGDFVEELQLDEYRQGNLTVDVTAMDRACKNVFSELDDLAGTLLFVHPSLDEAVFQAKLMKDQYQRMKLYALRVGTDTAKNLKKLKSFWLGTRKAAKAYKSAAKAWLELEDPPGESDKLQVSQILSFLGAFQRNFKTFMAKPVKSKTAIYYGVADYLQLGLSKMSADNSGLDGKAREKVKELTIVLAEARAFYKEFDKAAKSKKDYGKKVGNAVKALSSVMPAAP